MNLRAPIVAMLWEQWRLTRVEAAWRLGAAVAVGSLALINPEKGALVAFWSLVWLNAIIWLSLAKLNGGRFMDGYKPGFPLYLLYPRPVPTAVMVGVAMGYDALSGVVLYLAGGAFLNLVFGQSLPLFIMIPCILTSRLLYTCVQWALPSRTVQWGVSIVLYWPLFVMLKNHIGSPLHVAFSAIDQAVLLLISVACLGLTIAGVARQRRGDAVASVPKKAALSGYPDWLINLFRFPCPTSSATGAQIWFELRATGLPLLSLSLACALLIFLLFALGVVVAPVRPAAVAVSMFFAPLLLVALGGNAFGILRKQGRAYAGLFDTTQPCGTANMAALRILVRSGCVLIGLLVIGLSVWLSSSFISSWGSWVVDGKDSAPGLLDARHKLGLSLGNLTGHAVALPAILLSVAIAVMVAARAVFTALRARWSRRVNIGAALLLVYLLALVVLGLAEQRGLVPGSLPQAFLAATGWLVAAALVIGTAYLAWRVIAERLLTWRQVSLVAGLLAVFGATWLVLRAAGGVSLTGSNAAEATRMLLPILLPLFFCVLAPWSLSRIRHT